MVIYGPETGYRQQVFFRHHLYISSKLLKLLKQTNNKPSNPKEKYYHNKITGKNSLLTNPILMKLKGKSQSSRNNNQSKKMNIHEQPLLLQGFYNSK